MSDKEVNFGVDADGIIHVPLELVVETLKKQIADQALVVASLQGMRIILLDKIREQESHIKYVETLLGDCEGTHIVKSYNPIFQEAQDKGV